MDIKFPDKIKKYIELQCNGDLSLYNDFPELINIKDILNTLNPNKTLDIGSGIGRASMFLFKYFNWADTQFLLLDGDSGDKQLAGIRQDTDAFYNSLEATKLFCESNGLKNYKTYNAEENKYLEEFNIDLVFSFLAIGFHWGVNIYLDKIYNNLSVACILIFGIRGIEAKEWVDKQVKSINKKYEIVKYILKPTSSRESILILKKI